MFGYEGEGKDYHLMPVDPKSKEIKIRVMNFSGAGVGSASDTAWAANLALQASETSTRIWQKFGEYTQGETLLVTLRATIICLHSKVTNQELLLHVST